MIFIIDCISRFFGVFFVFLAKFKRKNLLIFFFANLRMNLFFFFLLLGFGLG